MKFVWTLLTLSTLAACAGVMLPPVTPVQVELARREWPEMTLEQLDSARTLYVLKCTACHGTKLPSNYSMMEWPKILTKMAKKAKITAEEKEVLWRYIASAHDLPPPTPIPQ